MARKIIRFAKLCNRLYDCIVLYLTYNLIITFYLILFAIGQKVHTASRTDLLKCKVTQKGLGYRGAVAKTAGNIRCQSWTAEEPMHEISTDISDKDFPERSMKVAKNYCRNPTGDNRGPWCYTLEPSLIDDECDVPLCNFGECRLSGPGAEYGGSKEISTSGGKCSVWHKNYQLINSKSPKFADKNFPDKSRKKARSFCRNPTGDLGGPWCYVEEENAEYVKKQYCDVPFCDDKDCLLFTKNTPDYDILTKFHTPGGNTSFWFKLWNPDDEKTGKVRVLLSLLPIPTSAEKIAEEWSAGVELEFANSGSRQSFPKYDDEESVENTPEILLGTKWTGIWVTWGGGIISAGIEGTLKPLVMQEYKKKHGITSLYPETFLYYGLGGTNILWSSAYCQSYCEMHTTFGATFPKVWAMQKNNDTVDVQYFVRAKENIHIRLYQTPALEYPCITIIIEKHVAMVTYQENQNSTKHYLKEISVSGLLNFWSWREFTISIFGAHFRLFVQKFRGAIELLFVNHNFFTTLRWFSIGSENSIAHWTLFCPPEASDAVEDPWPPNCISDLGDFQYNGTQWTAVGEIPCVPWISEQIPEEDKQDEKFPDGSALKALNKCRNPGHETSGPYCYAYTPGESETISKKHCSVRTCRSSECKMAGTANDYVGTLSKTRSGRACEKWPSKTKKAKPVTTSKPPRTTSTSRPSRGINRKFGAGRYGRQQHSESTPITHTTSKAPGSKVPKISSKVVRENFNDSLYPEGSAKNASNYCRNPSRNIAGTWCYTADPAVPRDLCNVRDCEKLEEFTYLAVGDGAGRRLYILPEYRSEGLHFSLKAWEPDAPDSVSFTFLADDGLKSRYVLKIGTSDNERVLLFYESETEPLSLVKQKTLPHLLYVGKWSGFIIRIPRGRILLFYEGDPTPLFEWSHPDPSNAFLPLYYYYGTEKGKAVGFSFDSESICHVENTKTDRYTRVLSVSTWIKKEIELPEHVTLQLRGKGVVFVPLYLMPATPGFFILKLNYPDGWVSFVKNMYSKTFHKQKAADLLFTTNSWTNITIRWFGNIIDVYSNETNVFHYKHNDPLLFYFFSIGVKPGNWITWSANCMPTDIDGPPVDGGWSEWGPWACSVSCNGGTGVRKRRCDSPKPNIRGEPCIGPNTMSGRCNEILCGDITEDTVNLINRRIRTNYTALTVEEDHSILIEADSDIVTLITKESPRSELQWSLNGVFVVKEVHRIEIKDYNIEINRAVGNDSGIYAMTLRRIDGSYSIIKVVSLAVVPAGASIQIRQTLSTVIQCHCTILGHVYSELQVSWILRNKIWKDYGITLPIAADIEHIHNINETHDGIWQCIVKQNDLNFAWITNMLYIRVLGPPNWRTHLMEDQATRFFFGWLPSEEYVGIVALILFLILVAAIIAGSYQYIRLQEGRKILINPKKPAEVSGTTEYEPLMNKGTIEGQGED